MIAARARRISRGARAPPTFKHHTCFGRHRPGVRKHIQYFDNNGSRGVYQDGWFASTFGPLTPWWRDVPPHRAQHRAMWAGHTAIELCSKPGLRGGMRVRA